MPTIRDERAPISSGDRDATTCAPEFIIVAATLAAMGYEVAINDPYGASSWCGNRPSARGPAQLANRDQSPALHERGDAAARRIRAAAESQSSADATRNFVLARVK
jgi:hypothetical protein